MRKVTFSTTSTAVLLCILLEMNTQIHTHARTHTHSNIFAHRWQLLSFSIAFDDLIYAKLYTSDVVEFDLNSSTIISHSENVHWLRSSIRNTLVILHFTEHFSLLFLNFSQSQCCDVYDCKLQITNCDVVKQTKEAEKSTLDSHHHRHNNNTNSNKNEIGDDKLQQQQ